MNRPMWRISGMTLSAIPLMLTLSCSRSEVPVPVGKSMPADTLRAGGIAYEAFSRSLSAERGKKNEFAKFVNSTDNYDVSIGSTEDSFLFTFEVRPFHGEIVKDGEDVYFVSKENWKAERLNR